MPAVKYVSALDFEAPIVELETKIEELSSFSQSTDVDLTEQIEKLRERCEEKKRLIFSKLTPWQRVQLARHPGRPLTSDYVQLIVEDFLELHGDRAFGNDPSILTGLGRIGGRKVLIVGHRKGRDTAEKVACHFGSSHPEGYRKAMGKMKLAAKFGLPIVTFINTPGAYPGVGAEERGQAFIIARNLMEMASLRVPIVCVVIGEGGSGGALGIGVGNRILMFEHSYYSVISPEGCAAILWKTAEHKEKAADILRLTASDLLGFGVIDEILPEPLGGAHRDHRQAGETLREAVLRHLAELSRLSPDALVADRYERFRKIGFYEMAQVERATAGPAASESGSLAASSGDPAGGESGAALPASSTRLAEGATSAVRPAGRHPREGLGAGEGGVAANGRDSSPTTPLATGGPNRS